LLNKEAFMRKQLFLFLFISCFSLRAMNDANELKAQIKQLSSNITLCATFFTTAVLADLYIEYKEYPISQFPYSHHRKEQKFLLYAQAMQLQSQAILNQSLASMK